MATEKPVTPMNLKRTDLLSIKPGSRAILMYAAGVHIDMPVEGEPGKTELVEFVIGARTREGLQVALNTIPAWNNFQLHQKYIHENALVLRREVVEDDEL